MVNRNNNIAQAGTCQSEGEGLSAEGRLLSWHYLDVTLDAIQDLGFLIFSQQDLIQAFRPRNREGDGTPLQYSCLENPMDRGAWWAAVYGVAQSQTRLKRLSSSGSK